MKKESKYVTRKKYDSLHRTWTNIHLDSLEVRADLRRKNYQLKIWLVFAVGIAIIMFMSNVVQTNQNQSLNEQLNRYNYEGLDTQNKLAQCYDVLDLCASHIEKPIIVNVTAEVIHND